MLTHVTVDTKPPPDATHPQHRDGQSTPGFPTGCTGDGLGQEDLAAELRAAGADMWVVLDTDGRIVRLNDQAAELTGQPADVIRGRHFWAVLPDPELRRVARKAFRSGLRAFGVARFDGTGPAARTVVWARTELDHDTRTTHLVTGLDLSRATLSRPILDVLHAAGHGVIVLPDLPDTGTGAVLRGDHERPASTGRAVRLGDGSGVVSAMGALREHKAEFCATASHELRTPVTSLLGYTEVLLDGGVGPLGARQRSVIERMNRSALRLSKLVDELLAMASNAPLDLFEPTRLDLVVHQAVAKARSAAGDRSISVDGPATQPDLFVHGSPSSLSQAVRHVVDNALQFTPDGGRVQISVAEDCGTAVITVADSGYGIPAADLPHVFVPFARSATATSRAIQGVGLGLTIAESNMAAHGGSIEIASTEGEGTCVVLRLPTATRPAPTATTDLVSADEG